MKESIVLTVGENALTQLDLFRKAADHVGLKLHKGRQEEAFSEPIREYVLDMEILAALEKYNIRREDRPDCRNEIFTLVDRNPHVEVPGWSPSNYWNFPLLEGDKRSFDLRITLYVDLSINREKRGIVLIPRALGSAVSAVDRLPNFRMFKALVEYDDDAPEIAKRLAASDGTIVVTWTKIGLGGIRRLTDLFTEYASDNEAVAKLGMNGDIFDPAPYPHHKQPSGELFIPEPVQPKIFDLWRMQLDEYLSRFFT